MASTSIQNSPSPPWIWKYDVFLSFRGEDTRYNFVDHLFAALHKRAVITFKDDIKLKKGKAISEELPKAIDESQICIVVLSKNYADSHWCLEELAKIVDCNEQVDRNQTVLPVFYDVDPSEVRKQSGSYGKAFAQHEETFTDSEKVQRWRKALTKVGNLSGWDARNNLNDGMQLLNNLRVLDLGGSKNLIKTPDFRGMPNLKRLNLRGCTSLTHVDESVRVLSKLEGLYLRNCRSLVSLPNSIFRLTSLRFIDLEFCSKLKNLFEKTSDAEYLKFIKKSTFTSSIVHKSVMSPLQFFTRRHKQQSELLLHSLQSLKSLSLGFCNLQELPDAIGGMQSLELLDLKGNKFVTLPSTISRLSKLAFLNLGECKNLQCLPELPLGIDTNFNGRKFEPNHNSFANFYGGGLFIFNCTVLVENEIQPYTNLAFSWLTKLLQEPHQPDARYDIVIPGNDVPKWFNHQSVGCSTRVRTS